MRREDGRENGNKKENLRKASIRVRRKREGGTTLGKTVNRKLRSIDVLAPSGGLRDLLHQ